jgi:hypothetical protein
VPQAPIDAYQPTGASIPAGWGISHYFCGAGCINGIQIDGLSPGSGGPALIVPGVGTGAPSDMVLMYPLTEGACAAIDQGLGLSSIPIEPSYVDTTQTAMTGLWSACITYSDATNLYRYIAVLVAN